MIMAPIGSEDCVTGEASVCKWQGVQDANEKSLVYMIDFWYQYTIENEGWKAEVNFPENKKSTGRCFRCIRVKG
jgi:hypothetical protein